MKNERERKKEREAEIERTDFAGGSPARRDNHPYRGLHTQRKKKNNSLNSFSQDYTNLHSSSDMYVQPACDYS